MNYESVNSQMGQSHFTLSKSNVAYG